MANYAVFDHGCTSNAFCVASSTCWISSRVSQQPNGKILEIEEKPQEPKSNYAVTGLYFYSNSVFDILKDLKPSKRNELEITDVNNYYVQQEICKGIILPGHWQDMGQCNSARDLINFLWDNK